MDHPKNSRHAELLLRISQMREEKNRQEEELKVSLKEFANTLNPVSIVKESLHEIARDKDIQFDVVKVGLKMGVTLLMNMAFGRTRSLKGHIGIVVVEKISASLINNNVSEIVSGVRSFLTQYAPAEANDKEND